MSLVVISRVLYYFFMDFLYLLFDDGFDAKNRKDWCYKKTKSILPKNTGAHCSNLSVMNMI